MRAISRDELNVLADSSWNIHKARLSGEQVREREALDHRVAGLDLEKLPRIFINFQQLNTLCMQDRGFVSVS